MNNTERYMKLCSCYPVSVNYISVRPPFPHQYDFAEECDNLVDFLQPYKKLPFDILSESDTKATQDICRKHVNLCHECLTNHERHGTRRELGYWYNCDLRDDLFLYDISIELFYSPDRTSIPKQCPHCSSPVYFSSERDSHARLSDIRLCGKPTSLYIRRVRVQCTKRDCRRLFGDERIVGMESYENSGMTLRLTASVLTCYLCGIKRKHLVEAYCISSSQVDRLKERVKRMRSQESVQADYQNLIRESKHIMQTRFGTSGASRLLDIFFQWDIHTDELKLVSAYDHVTFRDVWDRLRSGSTTISNEFDSKEAFVLAAVDHFAADSNMSNSELLLHMAALNLYYTMSADEGRFENIRSDDLSHATMLLHRHLFDKEYSFMSLLHQFQQMHQQLLDNNFFATADYLTSAEFLTLMRNAADDQEFDPQLPTNWEGILSVHKRAAESFAERLFREVSHHAPNISPTELIEQLLYFNPAVISQDFLDLFRTEEGIQHLESNQFYRHFHTDHPGVPLGCLEHLLKSGFLRDKNHAIHCHCTPKNASVRQVCKSYPLACPQWNPSQPIQLLSE